MSFERYSIVGFAFSAGVVLLDAYLIKKQKVRAGTFVRWLVIGLAVGVISMIPSVTSLLYEALGTGFLISALTVASFMVLILLIFYMDYRIDNLENKLAKVVVSSSAQQFAMGRNKNPTSQGIRKNEDD